MPGLTSLEKDVLLFECYEVEIDRDKYSEPVTDGKIAKAMKRLTAMGYLRTQVIPTEEGYSQARKVEDRQKAIKSL